jgi:branched-chain amino acid transport system permease protein
MENPELAQIQGINIQNTWLLVWGVSGSLTCLSGALVPLWFSFTVASGTQIITPVIAASLLGGIRSPRGFFLGGLVTGVLEIIIITGGMANFGNWFGEYRPIIVMVILYLVLLFRPEGLLGFKNQNEKMYQ